MSLTSIEHEPDLIWKHSGGSGYLMWKNSFLYYCQDEPCDEQCTVYADAAREVESQLMDPTRRPGRDLFRTIIDAPIRSIKQRDASSRQ